MRKSRILSVVLTSETRTPARPPALAPAEAAAELGVSAATVRRWIGEGRIPATRVGGRWRLDEGALERVVHRTADRGGGQ
jgi:excisionase family DNA binding protein